MDFLEHILPKTGERIGAYEIVGELGRGGFGIVYRARQTGLEADVALKIMIPPVGSRADQAQLYERFAQEARIIKELGHPAAIKVRDFGRTSGGLPYLVTEFVPGRTLDQLLSEEGPLPRARIVRIAKQVLGCLAEAHHRGVVHRDLKPANILIRDIYGEADSVKVLDFGIAKVLHSEGGVRSETGQRFGTPQYMSPEQVRGDKAQDGRLDLYAFGLILAECITGRPVVETPDSVAALFCHARPEPHEFEPAVTTSPLFSVIRIATQKEPADRYQDALAMRQAVERVELLTGVAPTLDGTPPAHGIPPRPVRRTQPEPPDTGPRRRTPEHTPVLASLAVVERRRRRRALAGIGVVLLAAGVAGALLVLDQPVEPASDADESAAERRAQDPTVGRESVSLPPQASPERPSASAPEAGATQGSQPRPRSDVQRRLVVLLPDGDLFNGPAGHPGRPDAAELRRGLVDVLKIIPTQVDLEIGLAVYNDTVDWLPEYEVTELDELETALARPRYVAQAGMLAENPWTAIEAAIPRLRIAQSAGGWPSTILIVVTSGLTDVDEANLDAEAARLRERLSAPDMAHVLTGVLVYSPTFTRDVLFDPTRAPMRVARGLTPFGSWYAVVGTAAEMQSALRSLLEQLLAMVDLMRAPAERDVHLVHAGFETESASIEHALDLAASMPPQAVLEQAEAELAAAHWDVVVQLLRAMPSDSIDREAVDALIAQARSERRSQDIYDTLLAAESYGRFGEAFAAFSEIPKGSYYYDRLMHEGAVERVEAAWLEQVIADSRGALERGDFDSARRALGPLEFYFPEKGEVTAQHQAINEAEARAEGSGP